MHITKTSRDGDVKLDTSVSNTDGNNNLQNNVGYVFGHNITNRTNGNYQRVSSGFRFI